MGFGIAMAILCVWFLGAAFINASKGRRFCMLYCLAVSVACGIGAAKVFGYA